MGKGSFFAFCLGLIFFLSAPAFSQPSVLTLATTTSTADTGLLDEILPVFEKQAGVKVKIIAVGTGQALQLGQRGDADVVMVHAKPAEEEFIRQGYGLERIEFMYNDFVVVGPPADPAKIKGSKDAVTALASIKESGQRWVSRGDNSGTHLREQEIRQKAKLVPGGTWYLEAGGGMAHTLRLANEKKAYTLSDRGTFLTWKNKLDLIILAEGDPLLLNYYGIIAVNPQIHPRTNIDGAKKLIAFLISKEGQKLIADFGKKKFGQPLFFPTVYKE